MMDRIEVKKMSIKDLESELRTLKSRYHDLRFAHSVTPLEKPMELRFIRRNIARVATELNVRKTNV